MNIGILALVIGLIFGIICLAIRPREKVMKRIDCRPIYLSQMVIDIPQEL